jgi:hypothetical protein
MLNIRGRAWIQEDTTVASRNGKHFSPTSKKLEKGSYAGDTATPRSVLEHNSQQEGQAPAAGLRRSNT